MIATGSPAQISCRFNDIHHSEVAKKKGNSARGQIATTRDKTLARSSRFRLIMARPFRNL
jgi:hypothetical protein